MKLNTFQLIVLGVFSFFILFGFFVFSGLIPLFNSGPTGVGGTVTLWGTIPERVMRTPLDGLRETLGDLYAVTYVEKSASSFDRELVEALASGRGPDLILLPHDLIARHRDKLSPIPFETLSLRDFKDTFIEEGELYVTPSGAIALPLVVDPLVMFWNRDFFSRAAIAEPPRYWDEFLTLAPELTKTDDALNIRESAVALGEYRNVAHAKELLSLLFLQAGTPIVIEENGASEVVLSERQGFVVPPAESALRFYTEFSNPVKPIYAWNRALPPSDDFFAADNLAVYFGFASEREALRSRSPHLNFDIAGMPQTRESKRERTFGALVGVGVLKQSGNQPTAFAAAFALADRAFVSALGEASGLPPARRDLLRAAPNDAFGKTLYRSALTSAAWVDPSPLASETIYQTMIESVVSGRSTVNEAILRAEAELQTLFNNP